MSGTVPLRLSARMASARALGRSGRYVRMALYWFGGRDWSWPRNNGMPLFVAMRGRDEAKEVWSVHEHRG